MGQVYAFNPYTTTLEKSFLSKSYASGVSSIQVKNTDRFANGQRILIGEMGRERSEIITIDGAPTATAISLDTPTEFPHDADDPVYVLDYDQVRIYRSTTGENGSYSVIATVNLDVDNANLVTVYDDSNALDTYWYQLAFYHSLDTAESDRSGSIPARGYEEDQIGSVISEVARKIKDLDFVDMDTQSYLDNANDISTDLTTQAKRPYRFLKRMEQLDIEANASTVPMPTTLWKINYVEVNEVGPAASRLFRPKKVSATEARYQLTQQTAAGDYVSEIAFDDEENEMIVVPKARTQRINAFNFHFYKKFTRFETFSSRIEGPTRLVYKLGLLREFYLMKADSDDKYLKKATEYGRLYNAEVIKLQREKNIEAGGPEGLAPDKKRYPQWGGRRYRQ